MFRLLMIACIALLAPIQAGCERKPAAAPASQDENAQPDHMLVAYTVRGVVTRLPTPDEPRMLMARHEAIPEYRKPGGKLGMNTMIMPFPLAAGVSLGSIAVGDKVEMTFEVRYTGDYRPVRYELTEIVKLPPETELDFSPLPEASDETAGAGLAP